MLVINLTNHFFQHVKAMNQPTAHFLHIGKAGGKAIKFALKDYVNSGFYTISTTPGHVPLTEYPKGEPFFFNLRNPMTRFTSAFYSRKRKPSTWNKVEIELFARFETPNELVEALCEQDLLAQKGMRGVGHLRPISLMFGGLEELKTRTDDILMVSMQESLETDFHILREKLGLPKQCKLPTNPQDAHKCPEGVDRSLSDRSLNFLTEFYRVDFELIEFCKSLNFQSN